MKTYFYYHRDRENKPLVTVCLLTGDMGVARGIAICSPQDNPCKATGRTIAMRRAERAIKGRNGHDDFIARREALQVIDDCTECDLWLNKSDRNPALTEYESKILGA